MERRMQPIVYLDTHIVVWLYAGLVKKLTNFAKKKIENSDVMISEIVRLELQYLYEIHRITDTPEKIIESLSQSIGLKLSNSALTDIIDQALTIDWTRDVFDRLIVAESMAYQKELISADENIRTHYNRTIWENIE